MSKSQTFSNIAEHGRTVSVDFWYPRTEGSIDTIRVGLVDVRAADDILIRYDFERDGYVISQPTIHEWDPGSDFDEGLREVAFVPAWHPEAKDLK